MIKRILILLLFIPACILDWILMFFGVFRWLLTGKDILPFSFIEELLK